MFSNSVEIGDVVKRISLEAEKMPILSNGDERIGIIVSNDHNNDMFYNVLVDGNVEVWFVNHIQKYSLIVS